MARYRKEHAEDDGWSRWVQPVEQGYKLSCCDCGLVHDMDFRIEDGRVQFRITRNNRSTGQVRRHRDAAQSVLRNPANSKKAKVARGKDVTQP